MAAGASDFSKRPVRIAELTLDQCTRGWNQYPCKLEGTLTLQEDFEDHTEWAVSDSCTAIANTTTGKTEGTYAQTPTIDNSDIDATFRKALGAPVDYSAVDTIRQDIYIKAAAALAKIDYISLFFMEDADANQTIFKVDAADLEVGEQTVSWDFTDPDSEVGSPSLDDVDAYQITIHKVNATDTFAANDLSFDNLRSYPWETFSRCYKTRGTCTNPDDYTATDQTITLMDADGPLPKNIDAFPCILSVTEPYSQIDERNGIGPVGTMKMVCQDFPADPIDVDPYFRQRPNLTGDFWKRFKAIHQHYENRTITIKRGWLEPDGSIIIANQTSRAYVLTFISDPDDRDNVTVQAKDPFVKLRGEVPEASSGELNADINDAVTTLTLSDDVASEYTLYDGTAPSAPAPIYIRIEDEIIKCEAASGAVLSSLTRAQFGTTAAAHDQDTLVQLCRLYEGNVVDAWEQIQIEREIPATQIDTAGAAAEEAAGLDNFDVYRLVSEPTDAGDLMQSLMECCMAFTWWDSDEQLTKIKMIKAPQGDSIQISDADILDKRPQPIELTVQRITSCVMYFAPISWIGNMKERGNYYRGKKHVDTDARSSVEYQQDKTKILFCPWFKETKGAEAFRVVSSLVSRFRDSPYAINFAIEKAAAESLATGSPVTVTTSAKTDADGEPLAIAGWARMTKEKKGNQIVTEIAFISGGFYGRYWYYQPDTAIGSTYATATEAQKQKAYLADASGRMSDGSNGYKAQ